MKITALETIRLEEFGNLIFVRLHTDQGIVGLGAAFMGPRAVGSAPNYCSFRDCSAAATSPRSIAATNGAGLK